MEEERAPSRLKSSLSNGLRTCCDLIVMNWLCILSILPIITGGPGLCGTYAVILRLARGESAHTARGFLDAFRSNFRQGLALGLICLGLGAVAGVDIFFALQQEGMFRALFITVGTIVALICLTIICYAFPLQAMFQNTVKGHLKNTFALAFCSPGRTLLLWLIALLPFASPLLLPPVVIRMLGFLYFIMGASGPLWLASKVLRKIFDKVNGGPIIPPPPEEEA